MPNTPDLSIIILNYNVRDLLINCLESLFKNKRVKDNWQIIVADNASRDGSVEAVKEKYHVIGMDSLPTFSVGPRGNDKVSKNTKDIIEVVQNRTNLGFSAGNNIGVKYSEAPVILFLNPDTVVIDAAIQKTYDYLMSNPDIGAITCRVELPDGRLDYSSHRGFPTPWNALTYFTGLAKLFPQSPVFAGYTASFLDISKTHEIDCLTGAFLMVRKIAGEQIGFWDEDYFWNGEDIEFCYSLKQKDWKIFFYPEAKVIHYKGSSSGLWSTALSQVEKEARVKAIMHGTSAMRIFYKKHFYHKYPVVIRDFVLIGIKILERYRKFRILFQD